MHKGVILLVKADDQKSAKYKAEKFLVRYGDGNVWDWYQIGGRWSGELDGYDPAKDPKNLKKCEYCNGSGMRMDALGVEERAKNPDYTCNGCDGKGKSVEWPTGWEDHLGDVSPLTDEKVHAKVKEWAENWNERQLDRIVKQKADFAGDAGMLEYLDKKKSKIQRDQFSFDSNVYDTVKKTNNLPQDASGYWAVMVDMHN